MAPPPPQQPPTPSLARWLDAGAGVAGPLALAVTVLLCLQWPLRDLVAAGSTLANDAAQALFALYVAVALRHASAREMHLVARADLAQLGGRWRQVAGALAVLPWALFLLVQSAPAVWQSVRQLERFPETDNPGYFVLRLALLLLAALLALQALLDLFPPRRSPASG